YTVELHDSLYQAGEPGHIRLKIGDFNYADLVYPLGGQRGAQAEVELVGSPLRPGPKTRINLTGIVGDIAVPLPASQMFAGFAAPIRVGVFPEILKTQTANGKLQEVTAPAVVNGRLGRPHQEDRFRLIVKPGMKLRFDVWANRAGSPLDAILNL